MEVSYLNSLTQIYEKKKVNGGIEGVKKRYQKREKNFNKNILIKYNLLRGEYNYE